MLKYLLCSFLILGCAKKHQINHQNDNENNKLFLNSKISKNQFINQLKYKLKNNDRIKIEKGNIKTGNSPLSYSVANTNPHRAYRLNYINGDLYYLIGADIKNDSWVEKEWDYFYYFSKWAVSNHFRTILIPRAKEVHLREAVQNDDTTVILWSSHGSSKGQILDYDRYALPLDVFSTNRGERFNALVLSNCNGDKAIKKYNIPQKVTYWNGTTTSDSFIDYIKSKRFDKWILESLGKENFDQNEEMIDLNNINFKYAAVELKDDYKNFLIESDSSKFRSKLIDFKKNGAEYVYVLGDDGVIYWLSNSNGKFGWKTSFNNIDKGTPINFISFVLSTEGITFYYSDILGNLFYRSNTENKKIEDSMLIHPLKKSWKILDTFKSRKYKDYLGGIDEDGNKYIWKNDKKNGKKYWQPIDEFKPSRTIKIN